MGLIIRLAVLAFSLWATVQLVPGLGFSGSIWSLILIAVLFAVVNTLVKPVVAILSLPAILLTLGLFYLVVNALMFGLVVWLSGPEVFDLGLTSSGAAATFFGAIVMSIISFVVGAVLPD
ncbi:MAG: phage holin family protein [Acidimicrobiia bacterium]